MPSTLNSVLTLASLLFLCANDGHAHHRNLLTVLSDAVKKRDFGAVRNLFSDEAWNGKKTDLAGRHLGALTKKADHAALASGATKGNRMVMGLKLYRSRNGRPDWVFVMIVAVEKPVPITLAGKRYDCHWRLERLTKNREEAESFLGQPLKYHGLPVNPSRE